METVSLAEQRARLALTEAHLANRGAPNPYLGAARRLYLARRWTQCERVAVRTLQGEPVSLANLARYFGCLAG